MKPKSVCPKNLQKVARIYKKFTKNLQKQVSSEQKRLRGCSKIFQKIFQKTFQKILENDASKGLNVKKQLAHTGLLRIGEKLYSTKILRKSA